MKPLINNIIIFLFISILFSFTIFTLYYIINKKTGLDIPALNFSDSYSFNEKIFFLSTVPKDANIIALGSSMTLNNLHSGTVTKELQSDKFLNTASWGMSMFDDYSFLKVLNHLYPVKSLIIISGFIDFKQPDKKIDYKFVENYLNNKNVQTCLYFLKNFNLKYYFEKSKYAFHVRHCINDYQYLSYDNYGTVNLKKDNFHVSEERWIRDYCEGYGFEKQYMYLDSISDFCTKNGIKLMFFQSPLRQGIYSELSQSKLTNLQIHTTKVQGIIEKNNQIFINSNEKLWADSLFLDATHLNDVGAQLFTAYCFDTMKTRTKKKEDKLY